MTCLFLDTSSSFLTLGILKENKTIDQIYTYLGKDMASETTVLLDQILKDNNLKPSDIDKIICVNGPGSFTGIRIGVTIAKTFAWALDKYVIPVSSLFTMACSITGYDYIIPIIDARHNALFAGIYDGNYEPVMVDQYIDKDQLLETVSHLKGNYMYVALEEYSGIDAMIYKPNLDNTVKRITKDPVHPHYLVPSYLKKTEAEERLSAIKSGE